MQSSEERAEIMLESMGGSLTIEAQRIALRRLIEAEDKVVDFQQVMIDCERAVENYASVAEMAARDRDEALENFAQATTEREQLAKLIDCAWSAQCGECLNAAHALLEVPTDHD